MPNPDDIVNEVEAWITNISSSPTANLASREGCHAFFQKLHQVAYHYYPYLYTDQHPPPLGGGGGGWRLIWAPNGHPIFQRSGLNLLVLVIVCAYVRMQPQWQ